MMCLEKEIEIIQRLVEHLKDYEISILRTVDIIAELDWWIFFHFIFDLCLCFC